MNKVSINISDKLYKIRLDFVASVRCCRYSQLLIVLLISALPVSPALLAASQFSVTDNLPSSESITSLWKKKRANHYVPYTKKQIQLAESIFEQLLLNRLSEKTFSQLRSLKLSLTKVNDLLLVSETLPPYRGQGLYVIRVKAEGDILLQAPHSFHDLKTGNIAIKMMRDNPIRALAMNTVSRKYLTSTGEKYNADMAHLPESLFMAFSRAFTRVHSNGKIVQLHGFNAEKRAQIFDEDNVKTNRLQMILSNGTRAVDQQLIQQKSCIDQTLSIQSHLYPLDINELGGTTNTIGRAVRQLGFSGFEHIEISLPVRKKLNHSKKMRRGLFECVSQ